ncbi:A disintegrin and metalloproteinase with thrombospondin motifs 16 isoform X2 [Electrophorus electricus]|uniref:A disintegrin and metalloproteinase with thrombospondin motifs 16 isoform X2 n=1 Tax=Electrophorus electricus TaxID=8005 RepID=UPI0015D0742E|nr:A disintegrin and metalloproteinase with thrombospondin motifs 16 isoform X2 [Electrophorus electricus]
MACFVPDRTSLTSTFVPVAILFILGNYECFQLSSPVPYTEPNGNDESSSSLLESLRLPLDSEYEIVAPYEVDQQGEYVSHAVAHHHRRRRSAEGFGTILGGMANFRLHGLGEDFHLELSPAYGLITPGFMVQTLGKNGSKSLQPFLEQEFCFYQGSVRSKANSSVALSTCTGMSGLIRTEQADYFLRPLHQQQLWAENYTAPPDHHPHILYKRHTSPQTSGGRERRHTPPQTGAERDRISSTVQKRHGKETELMDAFRDKRRPRLSTHEHTELGNGYHGRHNRHSNYRHGTRQRQHYCGRRKKYVLKPPGKDLYILPDEYSRFPARRKRAPGPPARPNQKLNVETLVVVDQKMMENHGRENITTYVLTVLNMVSTLFKDRTIGGDINIVIVGLILLPEDQEGLVISHHADHTLNSFCQWQSGLTGREGRRHDHAILLTGLDICSWKNEPCDTLGLAPISGMCSKYRSCTINEDTGLGLAFTIAHESGHNFGMVHDGEGNVCKKSVGNIMSPTLAGHNGLFSWSFCSRQYLSRFLSTAQATCLSDEPHAAQEYRYPEKLPGELYDTDTQCKWQFGVKAKLCMLNFKKDICKALWCHRVGRKCETKFMPAAEGSVCGPEMWCRRGQCVKQGEEGPRPVHGQWSSWSIWSSCSRTCESGVTYRERHCNSPKPASGGRFCEGSSRSYKLCNTEDCPQNSVDFRAAQCAEFNSKPFRGWYYTWRPYTRVDEGYDFFFALSSRVLDGTRCMEDSPNVCVDGLCERVGCDGVLGSMAELDMCGVCNGNNSTCKIYEGKYTKQHYTNDYYAVVTIPAGARSIHIAELNSSSSYLALRNTHRKYYLNGQWTVNWPGRRSVAGAVFYYRRPYNQPESLTSTGPTNETLVVEVLVDGGQAGVWWEYAVTSRGTENKHSYSWAVIPTQCSATCGRGEMITKASCYRDLRVQVNTSSCNARTRPSTGVQPCNTQPCPPSWIIGDWSTCSRTCGSGEQRRQVQCAQRTGPTQSDVLEDSRCVRPPPARTQACNTHTCPAAWVTGPWSQCSVTCGAGVQVRSVKCAEKDTEGRHAELAARKCRHTPRPSAKLQRPCVRPECPRGPGTSLPHWYTSPWSQCTVSCGGGVQLRSVQCLVHGRPSPGCSAQLKPSASQTCNTAYCHQHPHQGVVCADSYSWCHLVPQHGVCSHRFYGKQCCKSCSHTSV